MLLSPRWVVPQLVHLLPFLFKILIEYFWFLFGNYLEVRHAATGRHHGGIVSIREGWQEVRRGFRQRRSNFTQPLGRRKGFYLFLWC